MKPTLKLAKGRILKNYINSEVMRTCFAILVVLILIFLSTRFIKYIQLAVEGSISSGAVFTLLGLQIPTVAGFLLPLSFFMAILLTLGRLYVDSEMAVIKSVGMSESDIAKRILSIAIWVTVLTAILSLWVTPLSGYQARTLMAKERAEAKLGAFSPGKFQERKSQSGVVYVSEKNDDGSVSGIFSVTGVDESKPILEIQLSENAKFKKQDSNAENDISSASLKLEQGALYRYDRGSSQWQTLEYDSYYMSVDTSGIEEIKKRHRTMSTLELLARRTPADWAELHWRLSAPLSIPILCFLAVPLARTQPRKGKFSRLFPALMVYLTYALLMMNSRQLIEDEKIPVEAGFWWIHLLIIGLTFWLYKPRLLRSKLERMKRANQKATST